MSAYDVQVATGRGWETVGESWDDPNFAYGAAGRASDLHGVMARVVSRATGVVVATLDDAPTAAAERRAFAAGWNL